VGFRDFNITIIYVKALSWSHGDGIGFKIWMSPGLCWDCKYA